jgi:uncharacterized protein (DUF433 family)
MARGQPFSVRLEESTGRLVDAEARRTNRSRSAVVEALTEEAARTRRFPGLAFRGEDAQRRPWVIGTGLDVWEIAQMVAEAGSADMLVSGSHLLPAHIRLAMAYRSAYPDAIDQAIADNQRPIEDAGVLYPFIEVVPK